ncbi:hypothetical protein HDU77_000633 [Chytriomyces hyalinus]|nr:hypothetical protein HDU77_000633 [Chytriomyces hyalinus]
MTTFIHTSTTTTVFGVTKSVPEEEKPILDKLFKFRQSLIQLRKSSRGNVTVSEMNAKSAELTEIVSKLQQVRLSGDSNFMNIVLLSCNRVDNVLDTIWMHMFYLWSKIASIDERVYPTYVSLVTLARTAEALRQSEAFTAADVEPLQQRLRVLDERVAAAEGKFVPAGVVNTGGPLGDKIPHGQAILNSLLSRVHRTIQFMNTENDTVVDELVPLRNELESILKQLDEYQGDDKAALAPISKRLHAIDSNRSPTGKFLHCESEYGHATIAGILNQCFNKLTVLVAKMDPVLPDSPLYSIYRSLLEVHSDLSRISTDPSLHGNPFDLSQALEPIQERLTLLEQRRIDGNFVPSEQTASDINDGTAVKLPGQATMHKLLHDCHALITQIVDPISLPVGETLVSTYELLIKQRTRLRQLRSWASTGWDVKRDLKAVEDVLKTVEAGRVGGLFAGDVAIKLAESADFDRVGPVESDYVESSGVPDGQAVISALVDECDSLVWQIGCMLA